VIGLGVVIFKMLVSEVSFTLGSGEFCVWTTGVDCKAQKNFHCIPNFKNKIILIYLVISNFSVPWKFSKSFQKKKKKKSFLGLSEHTPP
jgi:hypothetical protein